jgi:hypothetical protein
MRLIQIISCKILEPGANPTSVVKTYNAMGSLVCFENADIVRSCKLRKSQDWLQTHSEEIRTLYQMCLICVFLGKRHATPLSGCTYIGTCMYVHKSSRESNLKTLWRDPISRPVAQISSVACSRRRYH